MDKITDRERTIYETICKRGITNIYDIANFLKISDKTVRHHLRNIYKKKNIHSIPDLIYKHWVLQAKVLIAMIKKGI